LVQLQYPYTQGSKEWLASSSAWDLQNWIHAALALDPDQPQTRKANVRAEKGSPVRLESDVKVCWIPGPGPGPGPGEDGAAYRPAALDQQARAVNGDTDSQMQLDSDSDTAAIANTEIQLIITIDAYLDLSSLFSPLPDLGQDMLGLILHSLIPASTVDTSRNEGEARAQALARFYNCLRPAPYISSPRTVQPESMASKLLPFQLRTVALLLDRERRGEASRGNGEVVDPTGFWDVLDWGKHGQVAYRRLTGELVRLNRTKEQDKMVPAAVMDRKGKGKETALDDMVDTDAGATVIYPGEVPALLDLSQVRGTMLCEEMGEFRLCIVPLVKY
jgi:E3 ubiquitin-protein ligase SHPRH